ncbi:MAG: hypothetical protein SGBAC_000230 [Bacillariaceae sp.]
MQRPKLGMERTLTGKRETNNILLIFDIDVSIPIQLMDESRVILEAKDMELQTVHQVGDGQDESSLLMQAICLGSIVAWIQDADDTRHPILSPFGYHASLFGLNCLQRVLQDVGNGTDASPGDKKDPTKQYAPEQVSEGSSARDIIDTTVRFPRVGKREPPVAPIISPTNGVTQRYTQATASATANAAPLGRTANGNASEYASYSVVDMPTPMQYPVATATLVAAPTNTILRSSDARLLKKVVTYKRTVLVSNLQLPVLQKTQLKANSSKNIVLTSAVDGRYSNYKGLQKQMLM